MEYEDMLNQSDEEAAGRLLATKILDLMDKLRLSNRNNEQGAKRWIWELLQNAKDVGHDDSGVSVAVDLVYQQGKPHLVFKHNGQPFNTKNITFLIRQVSTKDRKQKEGKKKTTGKFGTGFLSTHLLSEKVLVKGIVKDGNLPYKKFSLLLDRSPTDIEGVIVSVENTLKDIRKSLSPSQPEISFKPSEYNTIFEYQLEPAKVTVAEAGIADLHNSLPFTLAFSPDIRSVSILHEKVVYQIQGAPEPLTKNLELVTINETRHGEPPTSTRIVVVRGTKAAIAIQVGINDQTGRFFVKAFSNDQPKIFCDFPLIGSHDFRFPVIVNSSSFNANEPRSAIWLTDVNDPRVRENEDIIKEAVTLYKELLDYASINGWTNLFHLINIEPTIASEWLSKGWFDDNILQPIRQKILYTAIVDNDVNGRTSMFAEDDSPLVTFPVSTIEIVREKIWSLIQSFAPEKLPPLNEVHQWYNVIWSECDQFSLERLAEFIQGNVDMNGLAAALHQDRKGTMKWLNDFYDVMDKDPVFRQKIINDEYNVIPNQNGIFQVHSYLKVAEEVEDELKDALKILGVDIRDILVKEDAFTGEEITYTIYSSKQLIDHLNTLLQDTKIESKKKFDACDYIVALFSENNDFPTERRNTIYTFSKQLYPDTVGENRFLQTYYPDVYKEVDKLQIKAIVHNIAEEKTVEQLTKYLDFEKIEETLQWLHGFVEFLVKNDFQSQLDLKNNPILPNQNGEFTIKDNLNLDNGEIPDELKDICAALDSDFRSKLLDKTIYLELPENRVTTANHVADEILRLITPRIAEIPRQEETKSIFKQLYLYFTRNPEMANTLFKDLYANKHKLFDDEEIAANIEKMEQIDQLLTEYEIDDIAGLKSILRNALHNTGPRIELEKEPLTKEILAALGITSEEELQTLIGEDPSSNKFRHTSTATPEMYVYANTIIARARRNIIAHLKSLPEYVFEEENLDDLAPTVIGGIRKEGLQVHIVFRPSDNGQVLFYYPSEKATLDLANAELWIDDGVTTPSQLTLGRILSTTGINRIPIK